MDIVSLDAHFGQPGRITFCDSALGGPVVELAAPASRAVVSLQGAQVLSWQPDGIADVLWAAPKARLVSGKAFRGGVPVCWPWFGNDAADPSKPAHGFARTAAFKVTAASAAGRETMVQFVLEHRAAGPNALWPYHARLTVTVRIGPQLSMTLETSNLSNAPMPLSQALHTYFRVGDIGDVAVEGLENCPFLDTLTGQLETEQAPIQFDRETDRIYVPSTGQITLIDKALNRSIRMSGRGSASTIVWNPWIAKSQRLSDMGPDDYRSMLCLETANAGSDTRTLAPGASHILSAEISAERLPAK